MTVGLAWSTSLSARLLFASEADRVHGEEHEEAIARRNRPAPRFGRPAASAGVTVGLRSEQSSCRWRLAAIRREWVLITRIARDGTSHVGPSIHEQAHVPVPDDEPALELMDLVSVTVGKRTVATGSAVKAGTSAHDWQRVARRSEAE